MQTVHVCSETPTWTPIFEHCKIKRITVEHSLLSAALHYKLGFARADSLTRPARDMYVWSVSRGLCYLYPGRKINVCVPTEPGKKSDGAQKKLKFHVFEL